MRFPCCVLLIHSISSAVQNSLTRLHTHTHNVSQLYEFSWYRLLYPPHTLHPYLIVKLLASPKMGTHLCSGHPSDYISKYLPTTDLSRPAEHLSDRPSSMVMLVSLPIRHILGWTLATRLLPVTSSEIRPVLH